MKPSKWTELGGMYLVIYFMAWGTKIYNDSWAVATGLASWLGT